jgi:hypothetical protein
MATNKSVKKTTKGMGGYKSAKHQRKGGGKQNIDPRAGVGTMNDAYANDPNAQMSY